MTAHPDCQAPGSVCSEFVYLHDLFPTLLEVAGLSAPQIPDSKSILENILGHDAPTGRESIYCSFEGHIFHAPLRFVRTRTHKFVFNRVHIDELYDLAHDPYELRNLIDLPETQAVQAELVDQMRAHAAMLEDPMLRAIERTYLVTELQTRTTWARAPTAGTAGPQPISDIWRPHSDPPRYMPGGNSTPLPLEPQYGGTQPQS